MLESNLSQLLDVSAGVEVGFKGGKGLEQRLTGRFYTHERIGKAMAEEIADRYIVEEGKTLRLVDPFCGDGRLVSWLIEALCRAGKIPAPGVEIQMWDCDRNALVLAESAVTNVVDQLGIVNARISVSLGDSFSRALANERAFDICVTNPPWETIKPDSRELAELDENTKAAYIDLLKAKVFRLEKAFPHSKPRRKFSGWGANLARCGIEASVRLLRSEGLFGIVAPATIFGDQISAPLRTWLFSTNDVRVVHHYPAEARLFDGVDQSAVYVVGGRVGTASLHSPATKTLNIVQHPGKEGVADPTTLSLEMASLEAHGYSIGFSASVEIASVISLLTTFPCLGDYELTQGAPIKLGRELDETGIAEKLVQTGSHKFIKGRQVSRYSFDDSIAQYLSPEITVPPSASRCRIVWRDVARQSSVRRMIATLLPAGYVTGNSLNVLSVRPGFDDLLKPLLAIVNSAVFEAQVRATVSTNHLSVGAMRKIRVPNLTDEGFIQRLNILVDQHLAQRSLETAACVEAAVAEWYGISGDLLIKLIDQLPKNSSDDFDGFKKHLELKMGIKPSSIRITNHYASTLSELDLIVCRSVPPGGNWKDIPEDVPSERIKNIRISFAKGEGSRSTYYGRLHPDRPSYTINTYFSRPGNGCHIHYDYDGGQHRTLSQREAARLQSFPDNFEFVGSKTSIATQIGNAVPPLLAYQVARHLNIVGQTVDLFSGAGGLGLGFSWAGWKTLAANELEASFAVTYQQNVHKGMVVGDIRDFSVTSALEAMTIASRDPNLPLCILGGPPCQGFSTAGKKRSMDDERNWLFKDYCGLLGRLKPDVFVFENVTGLLNMDGGRVFNMVREELGRYAKRLMVWKLHSENYAIPQRRSRVIIVGDNTGRVPEFPPQILTEMVSKDLFGSLPLPPSVKDALDDLPRIGPGVDGGELGYRHNALTPYQKLMRGELTAKEYIDRFIR